MITIIKYASATLLSLTILTSGQVFSRQATPEPIRSGQSVIPELLQKTGVAGQVQLLQQFAIESSEANAARCNSEPVRHSIPSYSAGSILFDVESELIRKYAESPDEHAASLETINQWYQSPLAAKIRTAEKSPIDFEKFTGFIHTDLFNNQRRKVLIQRIVEHTRSTEFVTAIGAEIEYTGILHSGCIEKAAAAGKLNQEQTLADITRNDTELSALLLQSDITAEMTYILRDLSDAELSEYASFTSSQSASRFYKDLVNAVHHGLQRASDRVSMLSMQPQYSVLDF